jgi:hypothetical protein
MLPVPLADADTRRRSLAGAAEDVYLPAGRAFMRTGPAQG